MISSWVQAAVQQHPGLAELAALAAPGGGWTFLPASIHGVECLYGVREGPAVTETITVRSEDDVTVARMRNEDYLSPRRACGPQVLWEYTGGLPDAIRHLTDLPQHEHRSAPKLLRPASSTFALVNRRMI